MSEFVGAGLAFPMRTDPSGAMALVRGEHELAESMRLILGTAPGDRPMRPEFGCAIHDFVHDVADPSISGRIAFEVRRALTRWEPRIEVLGVDVATDPERATAYITVHWTLTTDNDPRNLVFPFYFIPEE